MERCFVIQPFDNDKFDKRFEDTFKTAIEKAEFEPYRIDKDLSVRIPIDQIEEEIRNSTICFAEITLDNPNVWYELGYAFACEKDVVLVCSEERTGKFPFDIQHRHIITYKTGSKSDFETLEETITKKIKALKQSSKTIKSLSVTPIKAQEGLKSHEIAIMLFVIENQITDEDSYSVYSLQHKMNDAGYTDVATSVGIRSLTKMKMIETFMAFDERNNNEYFACRLMEPGENWIMQNQSKLRFRKKEDETDDLPF